MKPSPRIPDARRTLRVAWYAALTVLAGLTGVVRAQTGPIEDLAAFPVEEDGQLRYAASNAVGDATLLYALSFGPVLRSVR